MNVEPTSKFEPDRKWLERKGIRVYEIGRTKDHRRLWTDGTVSRLHIIEENNTYGW